MKKAKKDSVLIALAYTVIYLEECQTYYQTFDTLKEARLFISDWTLAHLGQGPDDGYAIEALVLGQFIQHSNMFTKALA